MTSRGVGFCLFLAVVLFIITMHQPNKAMLLILLILIVWLVAKLLRKIDAPKDGDTS